MHKSEEKTIDGWTYTVTTLPARQGYRLWVKLVKVIAPALTEALGALDGEKIAKPSDLLGLDVARLLPSLGQVIETLAGDIDEATFDQVVLALRGVTTVRQADTLDADKTGSLKTDSLFDGHFAGEYLRMLKWLAFALGVQFGDFFSAADS